MKRSSYSRQELFRSAPVPSALWTMAVPTVISQLINLIYNMVDAFFIGRTGSSYMMAAASLTLTLVMLNVALSNLFGIGGGSLLSRLNGSGAPDRARQVCACSVWGSVLIALVYSALTGLFLDPLLRFLGASDQTIGYARSYALIVIVIGSLPAILSAVLAHLLRNAGYAGKASLGLSAGGLLNCVLDPLFMFVLMPRGQEVTGAAIATALSNAAACLYLLGAVRKASREAPLSLSPREARACKREDIAGIFAVGVPSAMLTGLFDLANISLNKLAAAHSDQLLAAVGIVMKVERLPNAVNIGICQGMLPIVAFNYASGDHARMRETIDTARKWGLMISAACIALFEAFAPQVSRAFLSVSSADAENALLTLGYAAFFLRVRCAASPVQFINYHTSFCLQAMGDGKGTLLHAFVRELVFYIPFMILLDRLFAETGLAAALPIGEACGAAFALWLLGRWIRKVRNA